jgi:hypothetical protein
MKINVLSPEKIQAELNRVQARAQVRTITTDCIFSAVLLIETHLKRILLKKNWKGLRFLVDCHSQSFASSYGGRPEATIFTLERGSVDWYVVEIIRGACGRQQKIMALNIATKAKELIEFQKSSIAWNI